MFCVIVCHGEQLRLPRSPWQCGPTWTHITHIWSLFQLSEEANVKYLANSSLALCLRLWAASWISLISVKRYKEIKTGCTLPLHLSGGCLTSTTHRHFLVEDLPTPPSPPTLLVVLALLARNKSLEEVQSKPQSQIARQDKPRQKQTSLIQTTFRYI